MRGCEISTHFCAVWRLRRLRLKILHFAPSNTTRIEADMSGLDWFIRLGVKVGVCIQLALMHPGPWIGLHKVAFIGWRDLSAFGAA